MLPFEFVIEDTPKSQQAESFSKNKWRAKVLNEALKLWVVGDKPTTEKVQITIMHFYKFIATPDIDNILKPIIDALKGLVYVDDNQVTDIIGRKRDVLEQFSVDNASPLLRRSLTKSVEFVYVKVEIAPDPRSL